MNPRHVDQIARSVATRCSRRQVICGLGGALAALLGHEAASAACKIDGKKCDKNKNCCSKICKKRKQGKKGLCHCKWPNEECKVTANCCLDYKCSSGRCCTGEGGFCGPSYPPDTCCDGLACDPNALKCLPIGGIYTCKHAPETCHDSDDCCDSLPCCGVGCCGGALGCGEQKWCCKWPGQPCKSMFDCCWGRGGDDPVTTCQPGAGGQKRCCVREGHHCAGATAPPNAVCCNGLVCDADTELCAKLGFGA